MSAANSAPASLADELFTGEQWLACLPKIGHEDHFVDVVRELSIFFVDEINLPYSFEQFRTTAAGNKLRNLVDYLIINTKNKVIISALLTLKWHFSTLELDDPKINETRATACEIVAWRYLSRLSEREAVDFCLYEIEPLPDMDQSICSSSTLVSERSMLLPRFASRRTTAVSRPASSSRRNALEAAMLNMGNTPIIRRDSDQKHAAQDPTSSFVGLTALEIAVVSDSKKFLSQAIIQKIITCIWRGDIFFWEDLNDHSVKQPQFYNRADSKPYARLKVPKYIKTFEFVFFVCFLILYYAVLMERNTYRISAAEILLYIWFAAFAYDEFSEFIGAGTMVYSVDIWNAFDSIIILIGAAFIGLRAVGMVKQDDNIIKTAFDILSLEALFMVPRLCSLLSLLPYFATLIPCLKAMMTDFIKFMVIVGIIQIGFVTTFSLLARETFTLREISWTLTRVFFGGSGEGFAIMNDIDPRLGPPLMIIYVCMTNILMVTTLVCVMRQSFSRIFENAREEQIYVYSVYVLEASTSNSLTHFFPPLNLIPLFLKPLNLLISTHNLRQLRIWLLRASHVPVVLIIFILEHLPWRDYHSGERLFSSAVPESTQLLIDAVKAKEKRMKNRSNDNGDDSGATRSSRSGAQSRVQSNTMGGAIIHEEFTAGGMLKNVEVEIPDGHCAEELALVKERETELEEKVAALSVQIAELTALIMRSQSNGGFGD